MGGFMDSKEASILREFCHLSESDLMYEIHDAVRKDTVRFNSPSNGVTAVSGFKVISVVPVP